VQEETPLQKLLRSEKDPLERTHPEEKVRRPSRSRAAEILEVDVKSTGELHIEEAETTSDGLNGCSWSDWSVWSECSSSCGEGSIKRSRGVQNKEGGDTLFAVKNAQLYKQAVSLMSPTSSWLKVQEDDMALESVAVSGAFIYAISSDQKLYRQHLSNLTTSSWMAVSTDRSWSQILPYRDALYGISQKTIFKATGGNISEEWSPAAWGEQWKQLAIGGAGTDGKLYQQALIGMSTDTSWQIASERSFQQVAAAGGKLYGVGIDKYIYVAEATSSLGSWSQVSSGSWASVMITGGMLYGLSSDQRLHRRDLGVSGSAGNWTTTADEGFTSFAVQRAAYTQYSLSISESSAGWCVEEMRFFDPTGGLLSPARSTGARSFRRPTFCGNSRGSLLYQFTQPTVVDTYYLQGGKSATGTTEVDWILQGSLDGSTWIGLDEQKEQPASGAMTSFKVLSQVCDPKDAQEEQNCTTVKPCPEDCSFSDWSDWSCAKCATTSTRSRTILSEAKNGGSCDDLKQTGQRCDPTTCPVDCVYNDWSSWSKCPVTCGSGHKTRNRTVKEEMRYGGKPCDKPTFEKEACNGQQCPMDCSWNDWGDYSPCSDSCGGGKKERRRSSNPALWGGVPCKGQQNETVACNMELCPVDCQWGDWQSWSECSKPCGGGRKERERSIAVQGGYGGLMCNESAKEAIDCNIAECSSDCLWGSWSNWTACSASCGSGKRNRSRQLKNEAIGEGSCAGKAKEDGACNAEPCPGDCILSDWSVWSPCSKTCGPGQRSRQKSPVKEPSNGGNACTPANQTQDCVTVELSKCSKAVGSANLTNGSNETLKVSKAAGSMNLTNGSSETVKVSKAAGSMNLTNGSSETVKVSKAASSMNLTNGSSETVKVAKAESSPSEGQVEKEESVKTVDINRPFSRPDQGDILDGMVTTNFTNGGEINGINASEVNKTEMNLTDLLRRASEDGVSHCMVYQRQPDVPQMQQIEVFEVKGTRTIDDCCYRCTYHNPSGDEDKACTAFRFMESVSGGQYCVLASGTAYNASMADPQGQWLVKMPKSRWPSEYVTSTTTTTMTTSTVTTTTITTTTVTSTTVTTTETQTSTATNTSTSTTTMNTTTTTNSSSAAEMQISSTTTVTTSTITMTMTTSAEERDFHEMGAPDEEAKIPEVPKEPAQWLVATQTESCDATCAAVGEECDFVHLKATADSQRETQVAFAQAGFSCLSFGTGCSPEDCPSWGAPFLHQSFMEGSTRQRNGQGDPCFLGNDVASCAQVPVDLNHRRLCACSMKNANETVVGYEVLEVSNVLTFLSSTAIKDSILEAVALLADVPKAAVKVSLQYLKTEKAPEISAEAGSVVMVHVINASATCKTPEVIRMALEADARAETVNKVLKPLLEAEGPFEEVGPGSCRDAQGNEYDVFSRNALDTLQGCKDACMLFTAAQCHGFTFEAGRCQLRMEDGFQEANGEWKLSWDAGRGQGSVASATEGTTRCFRRTDVTDLKATSNVTETEEEESTLSDILDYVPSIGNIFSGIGNLFR